MTWWEALSLFGQGALSAVWPIANAELLVSAWSVRADSTWALALGTLAFTVGHVVGKCALFAVVRYELRMPRGSGRIATELRKAEERLDRTVPDLRVRHVHHDEPRRRGLGRRARRHEQAAGERQGEQSASRRRPGHRRTG